ncbi:MAG: energy-coupling factor transporter transmembrane component T [Fervidicoccaceae archaeon]
MDGSRKSPKPSVLFLYSMAVSAMAFIFSSPAALAVPAILNSILGFPLGRRSLPMKLVFIILIFNMWGALLNGIYFHNEGFVVLSIGGFAVRSGAFASFITLNLRFFLIIGATLLMLGLSGGSRELVRSLERDLGMPPWIAFSISHAFRLFPLLSRDYGELIVARKEREVGTNIFNPIVLKEVLFSMLSVSYERAVWSGISAELRGVKIRKRSMRGKIELQDLAVLALAAAEWVYAFFSSSLI